MRILRILAVLLGLTTFCSLVFAEEVTRSDSTLLTLVEQAGLFYRIYDDGNLGIDFILDGGRSQQVVLRSEKNRIGELEFWEAVSIAWKDEIRPSAQIAHYLLEENSEKVVGAWELVNNQGEEYYLMFNVKIPVDCDPESFKIILQAIAIETDRLEDQLGTGDEF